jgi:hypothetical protein
MCRYKGDDIDYETCLQMQGSLQFKYIVLGVMGPDEDHENVSFLLTWFISYIFIHKFYVENKMNVLT